MMQMSTFLHVLLMHPFLSFFPSVFRTTICFSDVDNALFHLLHYPISPSSSANLTILFSMLASVLADLCSAAAGAQIKCQATVLDTQWLFFFALNVICYWPFFCTEVFPCTSSEFKVPWGSRKRWKKIRWRRRIRLLVVSSSVGMLAVKSVGVLATRRMGCWFYRKEGVLWSFPSLNPWPCRQGYD